MSSNSLRDLDRALLHPYTNLRKHEQTGPLVAVRGEGVRIFDDAGRSYIDAMAGLWCASLGFSPEHKSSPGAALSYFEDMPWGVFSIRG